MGYNYKEVPFTIDSIKYISILKFVDFFPIKGKNIPVTPSTKVPFSSRGKNLCLQEQRNEEKTMQENQTTTLSTNKRRRRRSKKPTNQPPVANTVSATQRQNLRKAAISERNQSRTKDTTDRPRQERRGAKPQTAKPVVSTSQTLQEEDAGLLLISRKAPTVKYANFDEYMKNHSSI